MKIVFDCRYTRIGRHDGISRYTAGIVGALAELHPVTMFISDERQLANLPDLPWILGPDPTRLSEPWVPRYLNDEHPDVVFCPMQTMGGTGKKYPLILTVHDLIYYRHRTPPRNLPAIVRLIWRAYHVSFAPQRWALRRADAIVTGSHTAKRELQAARMTDLPITVISSAVDPATAPPRPRERTLVYMGSFMPYKNAETLARAVALLPGYRLQLLSKITDRDRARLSALAPAGSIEFLNGVSDEQYAELLASATALLTASRDEGFGIPLIEAMSHGTPVVCSDIEVFREVGGDAALFANPDDPAAFAAQVRALEDPAEWKRRSELSLQRAGEYTWQASAATLLELATSLVDERRESSRR